MAKLIDEFLLGLDLEERVGLYVRDFNNQNYCCMCGRYKIHDVCECEMNRNARYWARFKKRIDNERRTV
jgi:hypothetical protein